MRIEDIIRRPLITEKASKLREEARIVAFEVDLRANKIEIKRAVEAQFKGAKVDRVRVARMTGKPRRQGRFAGHKPNWKKAYVRLTPDSKPIEFFEGV